MGGDSRQETRVESPTNINNSVTLNAPDLSVPLEHAAQTVAAAIQQAAALGAEAGTTAAAGWQESVKAAASALAGAIEKATVELHQEQAQGVSVLKWGLLALGLWWAMKGLR